MNTRAWMLKLKGATGAGLAAPIDWEAVYAEQMPHVFNYFRVRTTSLALVEDLTAATFERAWRSRGSYRPERGALSTWLFTIARNVAASHYRGRRHRHELPLDACDRTSPAAEVEDAVQRQDDLDRLRRLVVGLPPRERELIALKYGAELTNREIARVTGLRESNVGTRLYRIVQRLRAAWETPQP